MLGHLRQRTQCFLLGRLLSGLSLFVSGFPRRNESRSASRFPDDPSEIVPTPALSKLPARRPADGTLELPPSIAGAPSSPRPHSAMGSK